jgi:hypothetical protein
MSLTIGIAAETLSGERRLPVVPDVVKKYLALGAKVLMQKGAGRQAHYRDNDFSDVEFVDQAEQIFAPPCCLACCSRGAAPNAPSLWSCCPVSPVPRAWTCCPARPRWRATNAR